MRKSVKIGRGKHGRGCDSKRWVIWGCKFRRDLDISICKHVMTFSLAFWCCVDSYSGCQLTTFIPVVLQLCTNPNRLEPQLQILWIVLQFDLWSQTAGTLTVCGWHLWAAIWKLWQSGTKVWLNFTSTDNSSASCDACIQDSPSKEINAANIQKHFHRQHVIILNNCHMFTPL